MSTFIKKHTKFYLSALLFLVVFLFQGCDTGSQEDPTPLSAFAEANIGPKRPNSAYHNKVLADVRRATAHYKNHEVAMAAGYDKDQHCIAVPGLGGMGFHFVNGPLIFDGTIDPKQPEALLYEPQKNGRLELVAVEYIVDAGSWHETNDVPPMLGDQVFDDFTIVDENNPLGFSHYQLHVWVWKNNPAGMHTPFNPNVNCEYAM